LTLSANLQSSNFYGCSLNIQFHLRCENIKIRPPTQKKILALIS